MSSRAPEPVRDIPASSVHRMTVQSPIGLLTVFEESGALTMLVWSAGKRVRNARPTPLLKEAAAQLEAYFDRRLTRFDLPLAPAGTVFARTVWEALTGIPFGTARSYGDLARELHSAPRAVGRACGANPLPVIIPCHRVLAADGSLHGYSGHGGLETKAALLRLEGVTRAG